MQRCDCGLSTYGIGWRDESMRRNLGNKRDNGRRKRKCQKTKERSIEKWKIEGAPTDKEIGVRIRRGEWHIKEFKDDDIEEQNWNAKHRILQRKMLKTRRERQRTSKWRIEMKTYGNTAFNITRSCLTFNLWTQFLYYIK